MSPAQTAEEAARRMLDSKKLSNKINYDVLANLFNTEAIHQECVRTGHAAAPVVTVQRFCMLRDVCLASRTVRLSYGTRITRIR